MNGGVDETIHVVHLCKFEKEKKYKEEIVKEIIAAICAMLNSNGGKVMIYPDTDSRIEEGHPFSLMSFVIRILEQTMTSIVGVQQTVLKINFKTDNESISISVKNLASLVTTNYNLYLPSETQIVQVSPLEQVEKVKEDIMNRNVILDPVQLGTHCQTFTMHNGCSFHENKMVSFKHLKANSSKRTTLADRMTGKANKFSCYVSAFANYSGGHIYYGITDEGVVEGEFIPNEKDKGEIIKKVEKVINKMIWPEQIGQPKRGEQWEIFFESVIDENSNHIPSTFVIVICIAPCLGGVFTGGPECCGVVQGKVQKMTFATWRKRVLHLNGLGVPAVVQRVQWSSSATQRHCTEVDEVLMTAINNGNWEVFLKTAKCCENIYSEIEVKLVVLSKRVIASYRRGFFRQAYMFLNKYQELLPKAHDVLIFAVIHLYLKAALKRVETKFDDAREILDDALLQLEHSPPGLVTAAIFLFAAMIQNSGNEDGTSPAKLCTQVLQHLKHAPRSQVQVDMEQKAHIILATFHLGYDMSGTIIEKDVDELTLETAKSSLMALNRLVCDGYALNPYRDVQFNLAQSALYNRYSQVRPEGKKGFLEKAFQFSKKAKDLARANKFNEMLDWANASAALCTERLMHASFEKMVSARGKDKVGE